MRILGVDVGRRRIGLAISDHSRTLARPLTTLIVGPRDEDHGVARVVSEIARLAAEDDGLAAIVVGMPARLDGTPNQETPHVTAFMKALEARVVIPVVMEGEHLTSREAESRLAVHERDWRKRKKQIDAAAAAIILQDYLDRQA